MSRLKLIMRILGAVTAVCLAVVSAVGLGADAIAGRAAVLSVAAVAPDGIYGLLSLFVSDTEAAVTENKPQTEYEFTVQTGASASANQSITEAVEQQVLGNIVKKTLSPYNANTCFNNVYINNQSGASIDIAADLAEPLEFKVTKSAEPQILIYHTHATEGFMSDESEYYTNRDEPRSTDTEVNVVKVGEVIAQQLRNAGYTVIHDETLHDYPGYTGSYSRSAETVKSVLGQYPSVKIAIDVHRDSISSGDRDKVAPVTLVDGKEAAQVMLVMGSETGSVESYPEWRQNLRLATKLQYIFESRYPQFARALLLKSAKYNQDLTTGSILIEVGSDANTLEQALYSATLVGEVLTQLLESQ